MPHIFTVLRMLTTIFFLFLLVSVCCFSYYKVHFFLIMHAMCLQLLLIYFNTDLDKTFSHSAELPLTMNKYKPCF